MLTPFGKPVWLTILGLGAVLAGLFTYLWWPGAVLVVLLTLAGLSFFRDPRRTVPSMRGQIVSPADGRVRSIHRVEHFEPFEGPATCIRIFLSVFDVHIQRAPVHGRIASIEYREGLFRNALHRDSAESNEANTVVFVHATRGVPLCAVRQIAGAIARRIVCAAMVGDILQRGQRYGMIKFGSTVELYLPGHDRHEVEVQPGRYVHAGRTVLARLRAELQREAAAETTPD